MGEERSGETRMGHATPWDEGTLRALARKFQWQCPAPAAVSGACAKRKYLMDSRRPFSFSLPPACHPLNIYVLISRRASCEPSDFFFTLFYCIRRRAAFFTKKKTFYLGVDRGGAGRGDKLRSRCCQGQHLVVINELIISEMCFWVTLNNGSLRLLFSLANSSSEIELKNFWKMRKSVENSVVDMKRFVYN